nr:MAG TPA: hypothetical protein [Caudoviricetes sp.]
MSCSPSLSSNTSNSASSGLLNLNSNNELSNANGNVSTLKPNNN